MRWLERVLDWLRRAIFLRLRRAILRRQGLRQCPGLHVILYTRAHCPLCDDAARTLEDFQSRYGFTLEVKDVDASAELVAAHGNWVPVVAINGRLRFRGHVNVVLLQRIMDAKMEE